MAYEVKLVDRKKRERVEIVEDFSDAMQLWREWMRSKNAGDRITVRDVDSGEYKVIEHG